MMNVRQIGGAAEGGQTTTPAQIIWAHGWGQSGDAFAPLAQSFAPFATNYLLDFPGFGQNPPPAQAWGTKDYADDAAGWLKTLPAAPRIWIGHSFGCRVGIQIAANYPYLFDKMVLIAAAGLKPKRTMFQRINHKAKVLTFKTLKHLTPEGPKRDALRARFGSADYRTAGVLRESFVKIVNEDLKQEAKKVSCPTLIIVGTQDKDTPPELSQRLHSKIPNSTLQILDGFDHFTIMTAGRHQVASLIKGFMG
jgi:pimeloyl-ACP methyl ester carboxylesterase